MRKTYALKQQHSNHVTMLRFTLVLLLCALLCGGCQAGTENLAATAKTSTIISAAASAANSAPIQTTTTTTSHANAKTTAGARTLLRIYDECARADGGFVPCLKKKAISFIDRISYIDAITVADGVRLVRMPGAAATPIGGSRSNAAWQPLASENEIESTISTSRSGEDRDTKLTNMLIERLSHFFNGHSLQVSFPKLTTDEIGRGLEEGRGKMKKMMGMMVMGMAMKMMGMIPIAMGALYMMAGKALIISKIALLLAGIMGLKKLMSGRGGGGAGGGSAGWSAGGGGGGGGWSSGGGGGGGWDRRSLHEAHDLAYRSYRKQQQPQQQQQQKIQPALPLQQQV